MCGSVFRVQYLQEEAGRAWKAKEDFMKEVVFEQGFIGQAGFLETNVRGKRKNDGQFSAENFQAVEMA